MHPLLLFTLLFVPGIKCSEGVLQDILNFKRNGGEGYPFFGTEVTPIEEPKTVDVVNPGFSLSIHPGLRIMDFPRFQDTFLRNLLPKEFDRHFQTFLKCQDTDKNIYSSRSNNPSSSKISEYHTIWKKNEEGIFVPCGYVIRVFVRASTDPKNVATSENKILEKNISFGCNKSETQQNPIKNFNDYKTNLTPEMHDKINLNLNKVSPSSVDQNVVVDDIDKIRSFTDREKNENKIIRFLKKYPKSSDNKYFFDWINGKKNSLIEKTKLENIDAAIDERKDSSKIKTSSPFFQNLYADPKNSDNQRASLKDQNSEYRKKIIKNDFDSTAMKLFHKNGPIEKTFEVNFDIKPINDNSLFENSENHSSVKDHADSEMRNDIFTYPIHFSLGKTRSATNSDHESKRGISKRETDDDMYITDNVADTTKQNFFRNNYFDSRKYAGSFVSESEENIIPNDNLEKWNYYHQHEIHGIHPNPLKEHFIQKHRENKLKNYHGLVDIIKFKNNDNFIGNKDILASSKEEPSQFTVDMKLKESSSSENLNYDINNQTNASVETSEYTQDITNEPSLTRDQTKENSHIKSKPSLIITYDSRPMTDKEGLFSTTERKLVQTNVEPFGIETKMPETCPHLQELLFWNNVMKNALHMRSQMAQIKEILP